MPPRTILPNKFEKYFIIRPYDWHQNKIGYYHVSQIGANNQSFEQNEHSGPCLRNTFYQYINPIKNSDSKEGNFWVGKLFHGEGEEIAKINDPFHFPEFPLQRLLGHGKQKIIILGSIDLPRQKHLTLKDNPENPIIINITDLKTASDYTFPYDNSIKNKNPTNFNQVNIYAYWLINFYLNDKFNKINDLIIAYINKHEAYVGEQLEKYNNDKAMGIFIDFTSRAFELDTKLHRFLNTIKQMGDTYKPEIRIKQNKCLPNREPHRWCKFCENRFRCRDDVIFDCDVRKYSIEEIEVFYKNETGKSPIWRGNYTKAFEKYKFGFKMEGDEL